MKAPFLARTWRTAALPVMVLAAGWVLSSWLYVSMEQSRTRYDDARRESIISETEADLRIRMTVYENVLRFAAADLAIKDDFSSRENLRTFVDRQQLFTRYPGTSSFSIVKPIPASKLAAFTISERAQGWGNVQVRPMRGSLAVQALPVEFIVAAVEPEPVAAKAVGADLASDPRRRAAAERARDSGEAVLSSTLRLGDNTRGLQLFLPVYANRATPDSIASRRASLLAWVSITFSADEFFRSVLRERANYVDLRVFDGAESADTLMFSSASREGHSADERTTALAMDGTTWTMKWAPTTSFPFLSKAPSLWSAGSCALTALMLAGLVFRLISRAEWAHSRLVLEEKKAQQARAFLASLVQSSDDSIVGTTLDGTIVSWNAGSEHLWGYTAEEAIGQSITIIFRPGHKQDYLRSLEKIINREGLPLRYESLRVRRDGSLVDVSVIVSPIIDETGELVGTSAIYRDITERKEAEAELCRAKEAAESANRAKSAFLANMSHELRTPMNGVLGMVDILEDTDLNPEQKEYLSIARESGAALLDVINDILDFSKIEAGKLDLHVCDFILAEHLDSILKPFRVEARRKGLKLVFEADPALPAVWQGDATRIRQVVVNLLGNALKFTSRGEVGLTVAGHNTGTENQWELLFTVWDTGIGISRQKQKIIFDAFTQEDGSTTRRFGGTGLGLAISKRLAEMMGGEIRVESAPDQGATFWFNVPVIAVENAESKAVEPAAEAIAG